MLLTCWNPKGSGLLYLKEARALTTSSQLQAHLPTLQAPAQPSPSASCHLRLRGTGVHSEMTPHLGLRG